MSSKHSRKKGVMKVITDGEVTGAVQLDMTPCNGCKWADRLGPSKICKRYPPVWTTQLILEEAGPGGMPTMSQGGWAFAPSAMKCGEFAAEGDG